MWTESRGSQVGQPVGLYIFREVFPFLFCPTALFPVTFGTRKVHAGPGKMAQELRAFPGLVEIQF